MARNNFLSACIVELFVMHMHWLQKNHFPLYIIHSYTPEFMIALNNCKAQL